MNLLSKRFDELTAEGERVKATHRLSNSDMFGSRSYVDNDALVEWKVKVQNLLTTACGADSEHYKAWSSEAKAHTGETNHSILKRLQGVLAAAKEDYNGGYINSARQLVQAEVFSSELDQASELLSKKYYVAAAVIAGVVLETHLQELSRQHDVPPGKIETMNAELVKKGVYNVLRQKHITAHADLRNKAAHGVGGFTAEDVKAMIADVERFIAG